MGSLIAFVGAAALASCSRSDRGGTGAAPSARGDGPQTAALTEQLREPTALTDVTALPFPSATAADDEFLYWLNYDRRTLSRIPKTGGIAQVLAATRSDPRHLQLDERYAYWAENLPELRAGERIGGVMRVARVGAYDTCTHCIGVDASALYVTACCDVGTYTGQIIRVPRGNGASVVLTKDIYKPCNPVTDASSVYWSTTTSATAHSVLPGGALLKIDKGDEPAVERAGS